jgi:hypothetical protein
MTGEKVYFQVISLPSGAADTAVPWISNPRPPRWSLPYTLGVLGRWKMSSVYCQAVLLP